MAEIRSIEQIAAKWASVTPQRSADYEFGILNPRADWASRAVAANDGWKAGVQAAVTQDLFVRGVRRAGTPKWQQGARTKGVSRWGPGVQLAQDAYARGFAPFAEAIRRVQLPPRGARRDPRNLQRVQAVVNAINAAKQAQGGSSTP